MLRLYAIEFAKKGFPVFPCAKGGKIPCVKKGFYAAVSDPEAVETLFVAHPDANIGLRTGKESNRWVLDIDVKDGAKGTESLQQLEKQYGPLPETVESVTWSGGRQLFWNLPNSGTIINCKTAVMPGIDVRGEGGYVIVPPSVVNGKAYDWHHKRHLFDSPVANAPDWLIRLVTQPSTKVDTTLAEGPITKSTRNSTLTSMAGQLRRGGCEADEIENILQERNIRRCQPPLDPVEVRIIARSIGRKPKGDPANAFNPNTYAETILKEHTLIFCDDQYYEYSGSVYKPVHTDQIRKYIKDKLGNKNLLNKNNEVLQCVRLESFIKNEKLNGTELLNVQNGMLDVNDLKLTSHSPNLYSTIQLPVDYNPQAKCSLWLASLDCIFSDKPGDEKQQYINTLQEYFGLCLTKEVKYEKALFLLGDGRNGKSTILYVLQNILGSANYSSITLEALSNSNYVAVLFGKLVNVSIETNAKTSIYDALFKSIVSGDSISADRKYGHPFQFHPFCKLIFALNNMPQVNDKTDSFFERLIILRLTKQFKNEEQDKNLKYKLILERDGIFNWIIQGYQRLKLRGYFDIPKFVHYENEEYRKENNSVLIFVEEECIIDPNESITKSSLYYKYSTWCKESGFHAVSKKKFGMLLISLFKLSKLDTSSDKLIRIWRGVNIMPLSTNMPQNDNVPF